jgi:hypothetical protein
MENVDTAMREGRAGDGKGRVHDIEKNLVEIISKKKNNNCASIQAIEALHFSARIE